VEGGVDRARTWVPGAFGALRDGLHELVAVHRLLAQQEQSGGADVTALGPSAATASSRAASSLARAEAVSRAAVPAERAGLRMPVSPPAGKFGVHASSRCSWCTDTLTIYRDRLVSTPVAADP